MLLLPFSYTYSVVAMLPRTSCIMPLALDQGPAQTLGFRQVVVYVCRSGPRL